MTKDNEGGIRRRDFLRFAGVTAAGAAMAADPAQTGPAKVTFKELKRIPVDLSNPSALAVSRDGVIFAASENAIVAFDVAGKETGRFNVEGRPGCLALLPDGKLLAGLRNRLEVYEPKGARVAVWQDLGERGYLTSVVADEDDVFAADAGNRIVLRLGLDGKLKNRIGERNKEKGVEGFVIPSPYFDVALDPMGSLWATNCGKHGIENYRPNGELISSWYRSGMQMDAFCGCCNPIHIAFRSDSTLVTVEKGVSRVKVYSPDTQLLGVVSAEPPPAIDDNKALYCNVEPPIMDLAVDPQDHILILNKPEKAILVYEENKTG